jgi:uncharacterized protein
MTARERLVVDANALISRLLLPGSIPGQAVRRAVAEGQLLASDDTIMELADFLARPKFDPYVTIHERQEFLRLFNRIAERIAITHVVRVCRDSKDDKFLELAVNGAAQLIITGDADLLSLHPFSRDRYSHSDKLSRPMTSLAARFPPFSCSKPWLMNFRVRLFSVTVRTTFSGSAGFQSPP